MRREPALRAAHLKRSSKPRGSQAFRAAGDIRQSLHALRAHHLACSTVPTHGNSSFMAKVRRGGYVFLTWVGDHAPRHVDVYKDGELVPKWDLDNELPMRGTPSRRVLKYIRELREEGLL